MRRGFTLLETLLAASLLLVLLSLCVQAVVPILRHTSRTSARADLLQVAAVLSQRLVAVLEIHSVRQVIIRA